MLSLENLNSSIPVSVEVEKFIVGKAGFLADVWRKTPVYLVDPNLLDAVYPPEKRLVLNEDSLRRRIAGDNLPDERNQMRFDSNHEEIEGFWPRLNECWTEERQHPVVGCYKPELSPRDIQKVRSMSGNTIPDGPSIFVCPERLFSWAESLAPLPTKVSGNFKVMLAKTVCHELAHGYMTPIVGRNRTMWGRIIEESLANAIAYSRFTSPGDLSIVTWAIAQQSIEYRGYVYWIEFPKNMIRTYAGAWRDPESIGFDELLEWQSEYFWYWRRVPHELRMRIERFRYDQEIFWQEVAQRILREIM